MAKVRILCFHGYRQNVKLFREKTGGFRKLLKKTVDFVFVEAPHIIPEPNNVDLDEELKERGWFFSRPQKSYNAMDATDICTGYEESLKMVDEVFKRDGPFDGVLGFSQGAAMVSLLVDKLTDPSSSIKFSFAVFISGFKSLLDAHAHMYSSQKACPSFHIYGDDDAVIPVERSIELASMFSKNCVYRHKGGHYVPSSSELRQKLLEFLATFT
jgi:predicted esterase